MKKDQKVKLSIYNILGQKVKVLLNDSRKAGNNTVVWNGTDKNNKNVASGVYFYKMETESYSKSSKMILMK